MDEMKAEQQQPTESPTPAPGAAPSADNSQQSKDDKLSRNLLVAGLAIVAIALGFHLLSPQPTAGGRPSTTANGTNAAGDAGPLKPRAVPSIRGQQAPAITLKDLNGKPVALADFKGKVVLVNFWATWCQPCLLEIPWFIDFQKKYEKDGFQVLAISLDEEGPKIVKPYVDKHDMNVLSVVMGEEKTPNEFGGLLGLPTTFMVDRDGKYYSKHQGLVGKDEIEEEILILLGQPAQQARAVAASPSGTRP